MPDSTKPQNADPKPKKQQKEKEKEKENEKPAVDEAQAREESSKAANSAISAQKKSKELKDAARATGDPDERQKLMEQAMDEQIKAESFGKTAKYLRSGTFQGMAMGTGLGVAPGATLGALTGTLVGGVSSTLLGGLGGGVGAATGYLHGPFVNLGEKAGQGIQKVTGINSWGWKASPGQKKQLEKMVGQVSEQDMPDEKELERLGEEGGAQEGWMEGAKKAGGDAMPQIASMADAKGEGAEKIGEAMPDLGDGDGGEKDDGKSQKPRANGVKKKATSEETPEDVDGLKRENRKLKEENNSLRKEVERLRAGENPSQEQTEPKSERERKKPKKLEERSTRDRVSEEKSTRGSPRKIQRSSDGSGSSDKRPPRKLEKRSDG